MKNILFALAVTGLLAACSVEEPGQAVAPTGDAAVPADGGAIQRGQPLPRPLPQGFALRFPHDFRAESVVPATPREQRRRVTVEYLEGDAGDIVASLASSALDAGFKSGRWQVARDGRISFFAYKGGYGQMRAEISPGGRLSNPAAKGLVVLGWPVRVRPGTAPAAEATAQ